MWACVDCLLREKHLMHVESRNEEVLHSPPQAQWHAWTVLETRADQTHRTVVKVVEHKSRAQTDGAELTVPVLCAGVGRPLRPVARSTTPMQVQQLRQLARAA
jgi:hypothetical protein